VFADGVAAALGHRLPTYEGRDHVTDQTTGTWLTQEAYDRLKAEMDH
jgi:hypothetical protein